MLILGGKNFVASMPLEISRFVFVGVMKVKSMDCFRNRVTARRLRLSAQKPPVLMDAIDVVHSPASSQTPTSSPCLFVLNHTISIHL